MNQEDHYMRCPHCGYQTTIDPALVNPDDPMQYCPECDQPIFSSDLDEGDLSSLALAAAAKARPDLWSDERPFEEKFTNFGIIIPSSTHVDINGQSLRPNKIYSYQRPKKWKKIICFFLGHKWAESTEKLYIYSRDAGWGHPFQCKRCKKFMPSDF